MPEATSLDPELKHWLPPSSASTVRCGHWRWWDFAATSWTVADHINLGEARAAVLWLETLARERHSRHTRALLLSDSSVTVGAFSKGRSSASKLNRLLRRRLALEVAGGFVTVFRWIGTKFMPADRLSRERTVRGPVVGLMKQAREHCKRALG